MSGGKVKIEVRGSPGFEEKGAGKKNGDGEQVVVEHGYWNISCTFSREGCTCRIDMRRTVKVLKVGQFDPFPHAEHVGCRTNAIQ